MELYKDVRLKNKFWIDKSTTVLLYPGRSCPAREAKRLFLIDTTKEKKSL